VADNATGTESDPIDPTQLESRFSAVAAEHSPNCRVDSVSVLPGGHSGITLRAVLHHHGLKSQDVVVKMTKPGRPPVGRHDVLRQARILQALAPFDFPVPRVLFSDATEPPFFMMDLVEGESVEPIFNEVSLSPAVVEQRAHAAATVLAALHRIPLENLGLDLEVDPVLSLEAELARWGRVMDAVPEELCPRGNELRALLERDMPAATRSPSVVHGDFRLGNALCVDGEVKAVIDWEIWAFGDPRVDLGWFLVYTEAANFPDFGSDAPGMPSAADLVDTYARASGSKVDALPWFDAFAKYKNAAIYGHNLRRHREGRHHDPFYENLTETILRVVDRGIDVLERGI